MQGWMAVCIAPTSMQGVHSMQRERSVAPWPLSRWAFSTAAPPPETKGLLLLTRCTDFDRAWASALRRPRAYCTCMLCAAAPVRCRGVARAFDRGLLECLGKANRSLFRRLSGAADTSHILCAHRDLETLIKLTRSSIALIMCTTSHRPREKEYV